MRDPSGGGAALRLLSFRMTDGFRAERCLAITLEWWIPTLPCLLAGTFLLFIPERWIGSLHGAFEPARVGTYQ